jgi:hypothetical protein
LLSSNRINIYILFSPLKRVRGEGCTAGGESWDDKKRTQPIHSASTTSKYDSHHHTVGCVMQEEEEREG